MKLAATVPVGEAMRELLELAQAEEQARSRVDDVERQARSATANAAEAREALIQLEAAGPSPQQRKQAEARLAKAEEAAGQPWRERIDGAQRAARDARHTLVRHAAEHLDDLVAEIEESGRAAAEQVDHAAEAFVAAIDRRMAVERDLIQIVALTRTMGPNDVSRARSDDARQAVRRFIAQGGEDAPTLRIAAVPAA